MKSRRLFPITAVALFCSAGLAQAQINENFDTLATGPILAGWSFQNNAVTIGLTPGYFPGNTLVFTPFASVIGTSVPFTGPSDVAILSYAPDTPYCRSICWPAMAWTSRVHALESVAPENANPNAVITLMCVLRWSIPCS